MAINTAAKRKSACASRRLPWLRRHLPFPTGTVDQADREQAAFDYIGIAAASPPAVTAYLRMDHRFLVPRRRPV